MSSQQEPRFCEKCGGVLDVDDRCFTCRKRSNAPPSGQQKSAEPTTRPDDPERFDGGMIHLKWSWAMKNYATHLEQRLADAERGRSIMIKAAVKEGAKIVELEERLEAAEESGARLRKANRELFFGNEELKKRIIELE